MNELIGNWQFTDNREPEIYRDGSESFPIDSAEHLLSLLREYATKPPRVVIIESPDFGQVFLGIGGPWTSMRYYPSLTEHRSVEAKPNDQLHLGELWFVSESEPSQFKYGLPVELMIEVVLHLVCTGQLSELVEWQ